MLFNKISNMFLRNSTKGFASTNTLMGLAGAGVLSLLWWLSDDEESLENEVQPLFEIVKTAEFKLEFIEPGEIESAENVEIKSEVRSRSSTGVSILEIVPEGSVVKKGDFSNSTFELVSKITREEGISRLFTGVTPRVVKVAPACAIMIATYEVGKSYFGIETYLSK